MLDESSPNSKPLSRVYEYVSQTEPYFRANELSLPSPLPNCKKRDRGGEIVTSADSTRPDAFNGGSGAGPFLSLPLLARIEYSNKEDGDFLFDEFISALPMTNWLFSSASLGLVLPQPPRSDRITNSRPLFLDIYVSAESYIDMLSDGERWRNGPSGRRRNDVRSELHGDNAVLSEFDHCLEFLRR